MFRQIMIDWLINNKWKRHKYSFFNDKYKIVVFIDHVRLSEYSGLGFGPYRIILAQDPSLFPFLESIVS